jgi:hypothetical protein
MATYIDSLLAKTPLIATDAVSSLEIRNRRSASRRPVRVQELLMRPLNPIEDDNPFNRRLNPIDEDMWDAKEEDMWDAEEEDSPVVPDDVKRDYDIPNVSTPIFHPGFESVPDPEAGIDKPCPEPDEGIIIWKERPDLTSARIVLDSLDRKWERSQKEPLVEIPIKRTKQYFALIQEMEQYSQERAAKALDGIDGVTMSRKEEGIKNFERLFGGLRNIDHIENYQGVSPWENERRFVSKSRRLKRKRATQSSKLVPQNPASASSHEHFATPAKRKERAIWRFEDVSWVKQRTVQPRKQSFVGRLDQRVQLESGVQRYGPFGIGSGTIEGVGGVKQVSERGCDGKLSVGPRIEEKKRVRREIVV